MEKLLVKPMEAGEALGICRTRVYEMLATGELPSIRVGSRSIRIPVHALNRWVEKRENGNGTQEES